MSALRARPRWPVAVLPLLASFVLFGGCSNGTRDITGPSPSSSLGDPDIPFDARIAPSSTQDAGTGELQAPPGYFDHWDSPRIRVSTERWSREQQQGGVSLAPEAIWDLDVPAGQSVTFEWSARPRSRATIPPPRCEDCENGQIIGYRWALDIEDVSDNTPRQDENTDLAHWSVWSFVKSATIGPFDAGEEHVLSVEALDNRLYISLVTIRLHVVDEDTAELARY